MADEQDSMKEAPDFEVELVGSFTVNERDFLSTPVSYSNLPHVSFDGVMVNLSFLTWTLPPGLEPLERGNQVSVTARVSLPVDSARLLMRLLAESGVTPLPKQKGSEDEDDRSDV